MDARREDECLTTCLMGRLVNSKGSIRECGGNILPQSTLECICLPEEGESTVAL